VKVRHDCEVGKQRAGKYREDVVDLNVEEKDLAARDKGKFVLICCLRDSVGKEDFLDTAQYYDGYNMRYGRTDLAICNYKPVSSL
jgi:hypothetical protein